MKLLKTFTKYVTGSFFTLLAGLITTPILTRLISTEEMGKYSMFITVGSLFASILYLGLDQSYVRYYNDEEENSRVYLLSVCLKFPLILTGIVSFFMLLFYKQLSSTLIGAHSLLIVWIFIFYIFGLVIDRFWLLKIRMEQKAGAYSILDVVRKLSYLVISVILIFTAAKSSCWSLIIGVTVAEFVLLSGARIVERGNWKVENKSLRVSNRQLFKYGVPFIFSTTITLVFHSTDKLMLNALSDYNQIGLYSGAQNIVNLFTQVQNVFTTFWIPVAFEHYSKKPNEKDFFIRMNKIVSYAMLVVAILLLCFKDIVVLFLGAEYREAVYIFPFLAFMPIMYTVSETTVMGINFHEKTSYHMWISGISAIVNAVGNYFLIIQFGARGAAISTGLSYVIFFSLRTFLANKVYPVKFAIRRFAISCVVVYMLAIYASFSKVTLPFVVISCVAVIAITFLYRDVIKEGIGMLKTELQKRRKGV